MNWRNILAAVFVLLIGAESVSSICLCIFHGRKNSFCCFSLKVCCKDRSLGLGSNLYNDDYMKGSNNQVVASGKLKMPPSDTVGYGEEPEGKPLPYSTSHGYYATGGQSWSGGMGEQTGSYP